MICPKTMLFTVDIFTGIVLMYFIRNNNSILFQQIKNRVMVYRGTLNYSFLKSKETDTYNKLIYSHDCSYILLKLMHANFLALFVSGLLISYKL